MNPGDPALLDELRSLLPRPAKIQAVRRCRQRIGLGLKQAVDALAAEHGILPPPGGCLPFFRPR
jgi:hypothetical protein